jgi:hypothetical protein
MPKPPHFGKDGAPIWFLLFSCIAASAKLGDKMASRCDLALCWAVARETAARNAAPATNSLRLIVITSSAVANSIAVEGRPVRGIGDHAATMGAVYG